MLGAKERLLRVEPDELRSRISDRWTAAELVEHLDLPMGRVLDLALDLVYTEPVEYEDFIRMMTHVEEEYEEVTETETESYAT